MALSPTPQDFNKRLGQVVATAITEAGISQADASDRTTIPLTTLKRGLRGGGFNTIKLHLIASVLGTSVSSLVAQAESEDAA